MNDVHYLKNDVHYYLSIYEIHGIYEHYYLSIYEIYTECITISVYMKYMEYIIYLE